MNGFRTTTGVVSPGNVGLSQAGAQGDLSLALDPFRWGLAALTLMTLSRVHQQFGLLAMMRPALIAAGFLIVYATLNSRVIGQAPGLKTWQAKFMAALFGTACMSALFGISLGHSATYILGSYWKVLFGALLLVAAMRNARDLYTFVWTVVASGLTLAFLALFVFEMVTEQGFSRLAGQATYDANDVGCVALPIMALSILTLQSSKRVGKALSLVTLLALSMTIAKTGSRGAFLGLGVMGLSILLLSTHVSVTKRVRFVVLAAIGLGVAAPHGYWQQMSTMLQPKDDYNWTSPTGRKAVFLRGVGYFKHYPIFGVGIENFPMAEGTISERAQNFEEGVDEGIKWSYPHNSYLQAAAETGIVGLVLFAGLVFGSVVSLSRLRTRLPRVWINGTQEERFLYRACVYLPAALLGFAAASSFVSFAWLDLVYILVALVIGTEVAIRARLRSDPVPTEFQPTIAPSRRLMERGGLPLGVGFRLPSSDNQ
jgi:O-antigen ligase